MEKYNFYKTEMEGLADVESTVRVIEKSAASHIHFLKKKVHALSEYKDKIQTMLRRLSRFYWDTSHPLLSESNAGKKALLVMTGTKGIVGGLYHELTNEVVAKSYDYEYIWVIGEKGKKYLNEEGIQTEQLFAQFDFDGLPRNEEIKNMSADLFWRFQELKLKKIDVLYPSFVSLAEQRPAIIQFLPFEVKEEKFASGSDTSDGLPIFEPSKKFIFDTLIKKYIAVSFMELVFETKLSEFAARTVTAESAVKETERLIKTFHREFLKAKHLTITQRQVESFSVHQLTRT